MTVAYYETKTEAFDANSPEHQAWRLTLETLVGIAPDPALDVPAKIAA